MNKPRTSIKIAVGFAAVAVAIFYGPRLYSDWRVGQIELHEIKPGSVNIVGVDLGQGFRIVVANQMAQLRQVSAADSMKQGSGGVGGDDQDSDSNTTRKSRIPMREMMQSLQGNEEALSRFTMVLNDFHEDDLPPERIYWTAEDLKKALGGDATLKAKLVNDLNINLDGSPLPEVRVKSLEDGIVMKLPVPVKVNVAGEKKTLTATVLVPYKPKLLQRVELAIEKKSDINNAIIMGYYLDESKKVVANPKLREDVAGSLQTYLDSKSLARMGEPAERVLASATVVVNESMITKASYNSYSSTNGKLHDLSIELTGEGSDRLWKYSKGRVGTQLLLVADGIPIAAPRIQHELSQRSLDITQLPDEVLVREATDLINKHMAGEKSK